MNILNRVVDSESDGDYIKIDVLKKPFDLVNKDITKSKSLLENYFIKLTENIKLIKNNSNQSVKYIIY